MDIVGHIEAAKQEYQLGEPISVTLVVKNQGKDTAYLFVPTGRAGGIQIEVKQGQHFEVKDMLHEPEPGIQPEIKLGPGETLKQEIPLSEWLILKEPGSYIVECAIPIEVSRGSLREGDAKRLSEQVIIRSNVSLAIVARGSKNK